MNKLVSLVLFLSVFLTIAVSAVPAASKVHHRATPTVQAVRSVPLSASAMGSGDLVGANEAPAWACFGMGLLFGASVATGNAFTAIGSLVYIGTNCI